MQTKFGARSHVTKILQAKSGQKVDDFEPIYLGDYSILMKNGLWFLSTLSTITINEITQYSFCYVHLPQLEYYFSSFFFFFLTFFFFFLILLRLSTFKPLNSLYSKFERLKISGRTSAQLKLGVPGWRISLKRIVQNFELSNRRS